MDIIKNGDLNLAAQKRENRHRFECRDCGCVWSATQREYEWGNQLDPGPFCTCPCCGKTFCDSIGKEDK